MTVTLVGWLLIGESNGLVNTLTTFINQAVFLAHMWIFIYSMIKAMVVNNIAEAKGPSLSSLWAAFTSAIKACPIILKSSLIIFIFTKHGISVEQSPEC